MLFATTMMRNSIMPAYAIPRSLRVNVKDLLLLSVDPMSVFSARIKAKLTQMVAASFIAMKAGRFVLAMPASRGFNSTALKYRVPTTVVKQSMEPIITRKIFDALLNCSKWRLLLYLVRGYAFTKGGL